MKKINYLLSAACICLVTLGAIAEEKSARSESSEKSARTFVRSKMNWIVYKKAKSGFSLKDWNYHRPHWSIAMGRQRPNNVFWEVEYSQLGFYTKYDNCLSTSLADILLLNLGKEFQIQHSKNYFFLGGGIGGSLNRTKDPVYVLPSGTKIPNGTSKSRLKLSGQLFIGAHHKFNEHVYIGLNAQYTLLGRFGANSMCCSKINKRSGIGSIGLEIKSYI